MIYWTLISALLILKRGCKFLVKRKCYYHFIFAGCSAFKVYRDKIYSELQIRNFRDPLITLPALLNRETMGRFICLVVSLNF